MQLKCIVIDEEPWTFNLIKKFVCKIPFLQMAQATYDPAEATYLLQNNNADLIFIDVNIAEASMQLINASVNKPITILTSTYKKFAFQAFEAGAFDFLLKPLAFDRFIRAASRAFELHKIMHYFKNSSDDFLIVRSGYSAVKIFFGDIEYIESCINYIRIYLLKDKPILTLMTLKSIIQKLPPDKFKRVHKSFIVSVSQVKLIRLNKIILFSNKELPLRRRFKIF